MTTSPVRQAKTRKDSGELTRDQKRARERNANRPGEVMLPGKWVKRGPQPAVEPSPTSGLASLMRLAQEIREESNPAAKALLEARYRQEAVALAELVLDVNETKLLGIHAEIASTFGQIATQPLDPASLTRDSWRELHRCLLVARRRSMQWLTTSRRFGAERWGQTFVDDAEDNPPHARQHAQDPRRGVATFRAQTMPPTSTLPCPAMDTPPPGASRNLLAGGQRSGWGGVSVVPARHAKFHSPLRVSNDCLNLPQPAMATGVFHLSNSRLNLC